MSESAQVGSFCPLRGPIGRYNWDDSALPYWCRRGHTMVTDSSIHEFRGNISDWFRVLNDVYQPQSPTALEPDSFKGTIKRWGFGDVEVALYLSGAMHYTRTQQHVGPGCEDNYFVSIPRSSRSTMDLRKAGRTTIGVQGTMIMQHTAQPSELLHTAVAAYTVGIHGPALRDRFRNANRFVATTLSCVESASTLFFALAKSFIDSAESLDAGVRSAAGNKLIDLLAIALDAQWKGVPECGKVVREAHFERAQRYILRHHCRPTLSGEEVASACKISKRYLQHVFMQVGKCTVQDAIMEARLVSAKSLLSARCGAPDAISTVAYSCGFNDAAHFSKRFRQRFGISPSEFRNLGASRNQS